MIVMRLHHECLVNICITFFGLQLLELQSNKYTATQYYMNGLNKLSKYTTQLMLLSLRDYTLIFFSSLMICNSTTDEIFASYSVYFLFMLYFDSREQNLA